MRRRPVRTREAAPFYRDNMQLYFLYQTTNLLNNKIYVGVHTTSNLDDGYMGSGKILIRSIAKHGIENFRRDVIEYFNTPAEMYAREKEVVTAEFLLREDTYNLKHGGFGGFDYINKITSSEDKSRAGRMGQEAAMRSGNVNRFTREDGIKARAVLAHKMKTDPEFKARHKQNWSDAQLKSSTLEVRAKCKETYKAIEHQQGTKNSQYGTMWITDGTSNKKIKSDAAIPVDWYKGRQ